MSKYLKFIEDLAPTDRKTKVWFVSSMTNFMLGRIKWHGPWRKYCFFVAATGEYVFDKNCLREIADFCEEQTNLYMEKKTNVKDS